MTQTKNKNLRRELRREKRAAEKRDAEIAELKLCVNKLMNAIKKSREEKRGQTTPNKTKTN